MFNPNHVIIRLSCALLHILLSSTLNILMLLNRSWLWNGLFETSNPVLLVNCVFVLLVVFFIQGMPKKWPLFLSELHHISTKFDNFGTQIAKMTALCKVLIVHLSFSMHYRVKCRCPKLLHYVVIISIGLLTFLLTIWQSAMWCNNFVVLNILCWK